MFEVQIIQRVTWPLAIFGQYLDILSGKKLYSRLYLLSSWE